MARMRWVKTLEQVKQSKQNDPEFLESTVRSVRLEYETDPALARAVVPKPLETSGNPAVCVTFSHVAIHISPEFTMEIGSAIFGVRASYDGQSGIYLLTMPMTTEQAVTGGRETYGEPKKIAQIDFQRDGDAVSSVVTRMGIPYLEFRGSVGAPSDTAGFTEYGWCYKALPSCDADRDFDGDPILVRLEWRHEFDEVNEVEGELTLRDSPFDPVADLPVRRILRARYELGRTESNGRVLRSVPGDWLLPFLHQRYDDPANTGIEVAGS
jgi:acetoacetate decarboxylase